MIVLLEIPSVSHRLIHVHLNAFRFMLIGLNRTILKGTRKGSETKGKKKSVKASISFIVCY